MFYLKKLFNFYSLFFFLLIFNEITLSYFDKTPPLSDIAVTSIRKIQFFVILIFIYVKLIYLNQNLKFIHFKIFIYLKKISFFLVLFIIFDISLKFLGFGLNKHWFDEDEIRFNSPYDMFSNKPNVLDHNEFGFRGPKLVEELNPNLISIAFLGGSTGYTGTPPIPDLLSRKLNELNIKNVVYNFSVNSSNHNQHIHRLVKFMNYPFDIVVFYGGNNETIQYLQYETRPSYPYNYFIKNEIPIYKIFLLKYSSIFGLIENKFGIISGISKHRNQIKLNFDTWSDTIVENYINSIKKAEQIFKTSIITNKCKSPIFVPILQPVNPTNNRESKLWSKVQMAAKKYSNLLDYSYIYKEINFFDNVHVDQKSREIISSLMVKDLQSIILNQCYKND